MPYILPEILSLIQYKNLIEHQSEDNMRPERCEHCTKLNPWCHGNYPRKAARCDDDSSLNPIRIQRYYCPSCHKTMSVLPECIPPRRWYLWEIQHTAILLFWLSNSARAIEKQVKPSRHTIMRWVVWLRIQFKLHKDALCTHFPSVGLYIEPIHFWNQISKKLPFSTAMRLCHISGVSVP